MARSILADAPFKQHELVFTKSGGWGTDPDGQPIILPGDPEILTATFSPFKRTQVVRAEGADPHLIEGRGELMEPLDFPPGVGRGSTLACQYAGSHWSAFITNIVENDLVGVDFGAYFEATLTPAAAPPPPDPEPGP